MMEMLRILVRDKAQATGQQSGAVQLEQRKEDPAYPQGFTPPICASTTYASNGRIPIRLRTSPDIDTRSRIELRGKYSRPDNYSGPWQFEWTRKDKEGITGAIRKQWGSMEAWAHWRMPKGRGRVWCVWVGECLLQPWRIEAVMPWSYREIWVSSSWQSCYLIQPWQVGENQICLRKIKSLQRISWSE